MQMKAFVGRPLAEHPQLGGCISGWGGFNSVDVGSYNREEKVERRHRRDGDKARKRKKREEKEERKDREKGKGEREKIDGGEKRNGEGEQARLFL